MNLDLFNEELAINLAVIAGINSNSYLHCTYISV